MREKEAGPRVLMWSHERKHSWNRPANRLGLEVNDIYHWLQNSHEERGHVATCCVGVGRLELELVKVVGCGERTGEPNSTLVAERGARRDVFVHGREVMNRLGKWETWGKRGHAGLGVEMRRNMPVGPEAVGPYLA